MKTIARLLLTGVALFGALLLWMYYEARIDPVVRQVTLVMPHWPRGAAPIRVVLLSDVHAGTRTVTPERLTRIVAQVNALHPDLVLLAGDFTPASKPIEVASVRERLAPLAGLRARLGVVAVLGNHDHWTGAAAVRPALQRAGVTVLANQAIQRGPLAIGGIDDDYSRHASVPATLAAVRKLPGARLLLTHSPDIAPGLPADFPLLLAGHTHCGQIVLPFYGPVASVTKYGERYRCGAVREGGRLTVVTAGIGTSGPPLRLNAPPDMWLLTLRGPHH
jgi:predicted MPP superfamily phosphohydrolase